MADLEANEAIEEDNGKDNKKVEVAASKEANKEQQGMSQSSKDDLGVCVVIILIVVRAIIVTVIKAIIFDRVKYPELFGLEEEDLDGQMSHHYEDES